MVNNGAVGTTKEEINKTLGFGQDTGSMNEFCSKMLKESAKVDPSTKIEIANAAVVNSGGGAKLKDSFAKAVESYYDALVYYKDFSKEDVKGFINKWCGEKTHGMIPELLKEPVKPNEFAHFLNATYFKGIWSSQFKKSDSKKEMFTLENGSKISVNMMWQRLLSTTADSWHRQRPLPSVRQPGFQDAGHPSGKRKNYWGCQIFVRYNHLEFCCFRNVQS